MLLLKKTKKEGDKRIRIRVNVVGSCGPIRFVVRETATVGVVIEKVLKAYARERRLPVLGTKFGDFLLYTPVDGTEALDSREMIGRFGVRNFMLCKKPSQAAAETTKKSSGSWKSWFNKTLTLKVTPH